MPVEVRIMLVEKLPVDSLFFRSLDPQLLNRNLLNHLLRNENLKRLLNPEPHLLLLYHFMQQRLVLKMHLPFKLFLEMFLWDFSRSYCLSLILLSEFLHYENLFESVRNLEGRFLVLYLYDCRSKNYVLFYRYVQHLRRWLLYFYLLLRHFFETLLAFLLMF